MATAKNAATFRVTVKKNDFPDIARNMPVKAEKVVAKIALDLSAQMKTRAPYEFGFLRGSIRAARVSHAHWRVTVGAEYGIYQEYGTRFMAAQPYVAPSVRFIRPVFTKAMKAVAGT